MKAEIASLVALAWLLPTGADEFTMFDKHEHQFGLPGGLLAAVYLVESSNGTNLGDTRAVDVLSAEQRKYLQKIAQSTGRNVEEFYGSSAGALGQFQFMPSTWWRYKQDGDGDGVRDPFNLQDAAQTAAFFLAHQIARHGLDRALAKYGNAAWYARRVRLIMETHEYFVD
jgi:membrane-bound lytic murein transglycosylase B